MGTDEAIQFCRDLGCEPSLTVNVEGAGATAKEAAAWVEYCNGPSTSKDGAMPAANGHPEPWHVKYWEVGNEIWGDWVRGHSNAKTYAQHGRDSTSRRCAPSIPGIKIIACGDRDVKWDQAVIKATGNQIDYLAVHRYYGLEEMQRDNANLMARPLQEQRVRCFDPSGHRAAHDAVRSDLPQRMERVADTGAQYSMEAALFAARDRRAATRQRRRS